MHIPASNEFSPIAPRILHAGATELPGLVNNNLDVLGRLKKMYSHAITQAFILPIAASGIALILALGMEWRRLKKKGQDT